jgi:RNA polymerase sigma factor (sigma-70 family)
LAGSCIRAEFSKNTVTRGRFATNKILDETVVNLKMGRTCMVRDPSCSEPESEALQGAARLRSAIEEAHASLLRSVAVLVAKTGPGQRWPQVMELAAEVLHEAVEQALKHASEFDTTRSPTAWVRGIAVRILLSRRRKEARNRRCVPATVLGEEAWAAVLAQLHTESEDAAVAGRLDLEEALGCLNQEERRALQCRYFEGLDGEALARALGVATPGAARVRVCRALQALRTHFPLTEEEVLP